MCGIAGFIDRSLSDEASYTIQAMTDAISYRGPNDSGYWIDLHAGLALGHRRLSILDLSPLGHQPMHSGRDRFVIVFNGEIYNYRDVCAELRSLGHTFLGQSDTEVMLAAFEEWGVPRAIEKFTGMFAFAVWDKAARTLYLARDRIGKKPLYYGWSDGMFIFGSELKALRAHPKFKNKTDRNAVRDFLRLGYIPSPDCIYQGIYKLPPGTFFSITPQQAFTASPGFSPQPGKSKDGLCPVRYWSVEKAAEAGAAYPFRGTEEQAAAELERMLGDAVRIRMIADVPLGAFLSGGIDSSLVVAIMQSQSTLPVRTFSIGFHEPEFDESRYARAVAQHLGTDHTELYVNPDDGLNVIPLLPYIFDEPFSDSSQIPTYLVSKLCREYVTVSLSGDGGDELFGGYDRYPWAQSVWRWLKWVPPGVRKAAAAGTEYIPKGFRRTGLGSKLFTLGRVLGYTADRSLYEGIMSNWDRSAPASESLRPQPSDGDSLVSQMMVSDMCGYLPDDILVKVDRASMAVSLETRAPFLDHRVVEFACSLPLKHKFRGGKGKHILRRLLARHVPSHLIDRPKMGFRVPVAAWLRRELRDWAENLLEPEKLKSQGFIDPASIHEKWSEHLSGSNRWEHQIWSALMFQAWYEANEAKPSSSSVQIAAHAGL